MILIGLLFVYLIGSSECWNTTDKYVSKEGNFQSKSSKLLTFNTDDDDIKVEMDFVVPFIKIPVKKSLDMTKGALANINLGAVLLAGLFAFAITIVLPTIFAFLNKKLFESSKKAGYSTDFHKLYKDSDSNSSEIWRYLTILDNALLERNLDTTSCVQRMICWTVKKSSANVSSGKGTSIDKILDGLATNEWLQSCISSTPFHSALKNGLDDLNCSREYDKCKVTSRTVNTFVKQFVKMINGE